MTLLTKLVLILEFLVAAVLGLVALVALVIFGSMAREESVLLRSTIILGVAVASTVSAIRITGYYAFNERGQIHNTWWRVAWLGFISSSLSLVMVLLNKILPLGLEGDDYVVLRLLSVGVVLAPAFFHCLYLERKKVSE